MKKYIYGCLMICSLLLVSVLLCGCKPQQTDFEAKQLFQSRSVSAHWPDFEVQIKADVLYVEGELYGTFTDTYNDFGAIVNENIYLFYPEDELLQKILTVKEYHYAKLAEGANSGKALFPEAYLFKLEGKYYLAFGFEQKGIRRVERILELI